MDWLLLGMAALAAYLLLKPKADTQTGGGGSGSGRTYAGPGACIFWQHKTQAGFECLGYSDEVGPGANGGLVVYNARIVDMTSPGGIIEVPRLVIEAPTLDKLPAVVVGGHVLYHLTAAGILDDKAGAMMFPGTGAADSAAIRAKVKQVLDGRHQEGAARNFWTWLATLPAQLVDWVQELITTGGITFDSGKGLAAGAFTIPRRVESLYQVNGSKWSTYWQAASPYAVNIEVDPKAFEQELGQR